MEPPTIVPTLNYLDLLPSEVIQQFLLKIDNLEDLAKWCQVSKRAAEFCRDEGFWHQKYIQDFGSRVLLSEGDTWKKKYRRLALSGRFPPFSLAREDSSYPKDIIYGIISEENILYMTGNNKYGQLGNGTTTWSRELINSFQIKVTSVSCARIFTGAITKEGKCYLWGNLTPLKPTLRGLTLRPLEFKLPSRGVKISCWANIYDDGPSMIFAVLLEDGSVYFSAHFSDSDDENVTGHFFAQARDIYTGPGYIAYIDQKGGLYFWGGPIFMRGTTYDLDKVIHFGFPKPIQGITTQDENLTILTKDGEVYQRGTNEYGEFGFFEDLDDLEDVDSMTKLEDVDSMTKLELPPISYISTDEHNSVAVTKDRRLIIWGSRTRWEVEDKHHRETTPPTYLDFGLPILTAIIEGPILLYLTNDGIPHITTVRDS